jgi:hypothetical protein
MQQQTFNGALTTAAKSSCRQLPAAISLNMPSSTQYPDLTGLFPVCQHSLSTLFVNTVCQHICIVT